MILRLAVLVELRLVTDRQTDRHRHGHGQTQAYGYYRGCIASRGKNSTAMKSDGDFLRQLSLFMQFLLALHKRLVICEHRPHLADGRQYWFGLYKETAIPQGNKELPGGTTATSRRIEAGGDVNPTSTLDASGTRRMDSWTGNVTSVFTARCYASAVLAMGLCLCLSVCLSQVGVLL